MHLYLAAAAGGKTAYLVDLARWLSRDLQETPRVVVSTQLQVRAWRQRLAVWHADVPWTAGGGALGVRVGTFDTLYRDILAGAGEAYTLIGDPVQFRLVRKVVEEARLVHYASLQRMPGFVQVVLRLIRELKAAGIRPETLVAALRAGADEPRLVELADLYLAYQDILQTRGWADYAGMGWLAAAALAAHPDVGVGWSPVLVDGFDDLSSVQRQVLTLLSRRAKDVVVTLTGMPDGSRRDLVHRRFNRTRDRLEAAFGVTAEPLPPSRACLRATPLPPRARLRATLPPPGIRAEPLLQLEAHFLEAPSQQTPAGDVVSMIAAPDRHGEVRAALRWLKERLVFDGMRLREVALLARKISPYRAFIAQTANEFGVPVQLVDGYPLRGNPAVAALLDLIRLASAGESRFPWRPVVAAWRSPYFEWRFGCSAAEQGEDGELRIAPQDAEALDRVARWASVVGGLDQWDEAFDLLAEAGVLQDLEHGEPEVPSNLPTGERAQRLRQKFLAFVRCISPPEGVAPCRGFVTWLEGLIGDFEDAAEPPEAVGEGIHGVGLARCIETGPRSLRSRDTAALNALKDVLRGLVWADEAVACEPVDFARFFSDLVGAIDAAVYRPPLSSGEEAVLVTDVAAARGLSFRAVAILGLAEGEFPAALSEDPLLPDKDRAWLRANHGLELDLSSDSAEAGYFYEAFTRATEALLLTRPRVADNGAEWQASPYWDEVRARVVAHAETLLSGSHPDVTHCASEAELVYAVASIWGTRPGIRDWFSARYPERCTALTLASDVLRQRAGADRVPEAGYDGGLQSWADTFTARYSPGRSWSTSRLESYTSCPFGFFTGSVLGLEPRQLPAEGLDARQLGNIYHHIFEALYRAVSDPADLDQLLAALPAAANAVLDHAPRREQFRPTAWWAQTRSEIVENVRHSLEMLDEAGDGFEPYAFEAAFGIGDAPALVVQDDADSFLLRGFIDRVDRRPDGRVRIIDYKTASKNRFTARALQDGKKLQLPLYALAAQEVLGFGEVTDGFYWHVQHGERSSLTLARFEGGAAAALSTAVEHAWTVIRSARAGVFVPKPPIGGCPRYCAASGFCWHYTPGW